MATIFSAELTGTNLQSVTEANSGFSNVTGAWAYTTTGTGSGVSSAQIDISPAATGVLQTNRASASSVGYHDFLAKLDSFDGGGIILAQLRSGGTNRAQLRVNSDGTINMRNGTTTVNDTDAEVTLNQWFRIQWGFSGSTQTMRLFTSATLADLFNNPATEIITGSYTQGSWDQFRVGCMAAKEVLVTIDRVIVDDSTWPTSGGAGNVTPTANAGPDQTVTSGDVVNLNGSGTDPDGTIASYAWTQTGGPTATLSSATAEDPTFTAPSVTVDSEMVFELRVTDDDGAQSTPNSVTITVEPEVVTPTAEFFELFEGVAAGTAITTANSNFDLSVDSGMTFVAMSLGEGSQAASGSVSSGTQIATAMITGGLVSEYYLDAVFLLPSLSGGPWHLLRIRSGSTLRAHCRVDNDGQITIRNGTTTVGTTDAIVIANEPFRLAWHLDLVAGEQTARLFTGVNLWGTSPDAGGEVTDDFNTGTFDRFGVGPSLPSTGTWFVDSVRGDPDDWPEPLVASTSHSNLWVVTEAGTLSEVGVSVL